VLYWVEIYALVAVLVFAGAGLVILSLFIWFKAKEWRPLKIAPERRLVSADISPDRRKASREFPNPFAN
jgi:hypothetical protein